MPLFHTSFFPLFTHVNLNPLAVAVNPALVHVEPALGDAEKPGWPSKTRARVITDIATARAFDGMVKV